MRQLKEKPAKKRVGFLSSGAPARAGVKIIDDAGNEIGVVTSGCPAPSIKGRNIYHVSTRIRPSLEDLFILIVIIISGKNVAMGYVQTAHAKNGTAVNFEVRKKKVPAVVSKMPFLPSGYYTG